MGNKLKLRVAQNTQDIETMKLLVQSVLTDVELELLGRLRAELAYKTDTQGPFYPGFKAALDHLIGLHFIEERYKGAYPAFEARKTESDANEFFRIRSDGKDFLKQYEKLLGVIDLEQLDRITGGRIGL